MNQPKPEDSPRIFNDSARSIGEHGRVILRCVQSLVDQADPPADEMLRRLQKLTQERKPIQQAIELLCDFYATAEGTDWRLLRYQMGVAKSYDHDAAPGVPPWVATFNEPPLPT